MCFHPVLRYVQSLKSTAHQEGMLNFITKFHSNEQTRKQTYKNVLKIRGQFLHSHRCITIRRRKKNYLMKKYSHYDYRYVPPKRLSSFLSSDVLFQSKMGYGRQKQIFVVFLENIALFGKMFNGKNSQPYFQ